jgi:hypothetical protein
VQAMCHTRGPVYQKKLDWHAVISHRQDGL